ncbi:hypothetical protein [Caenispirillum bisanense]|uniref:Uncharacterized protein n=1 Tax=Caenispirillum bisanense TaxID=414052 RepID=A0A286G5W9_9PROT|nr:hypothetical protein [Caenispirillum bisanense]SOD90947.1 hypothetical protein SAMN05421508_101732 [Caenispirillum bisanense]
MISYHDLSDADYIQCRNTVVKTFENPQLALGQNPAVMGNIVDVLGNPTVGYGYDLTQHDLPAIQVAFTAAFDGTLTATAQAALEQIGRWKAGQLTAAALCAWRPATPLFDDATATRLLSQVLDSEYEAVLDRALARTAGLAVPRSRERAALQSLVYNGGGGMVGPGLRGALAAGNRALAWWEIRYDSNAGNVGGLAVRRCFEGDLFGLYDDSAAPTAAERQQVQALLAGHGAQMAAYDARFPTAVAQANANEASMLSLLPAGRVQTLAEATG